MLKRSSPRSSTAASTGKGSSVTVVSGDEYHIVFSDNGRGMSHADLQRLFQPFRTNFPSGTGLGMAISYRIVQEHGGRIEVSSHEGSGTSITVSLPVSVTTIRNAVA